jgi:hypothetical protein
MKQMKILTDERDAVDDFISKVLHHVEEVDGLTPSKHSAVGS